MSTPGWLDAKIAATSDHAIPTTCQRCGAPVLTARPGRVAALDVALDLDPLTPLEEVRALLEGRLTWHLVIGALGTQRITWRGTTHITAGPARHPVLRDHHCPREGTL
ncbi:hypothetical protein ACMA1D_02120 [Streptomyces sp. 796.1]|uniref:hypothetical protein n=1 Tax=Streptomyces TaxID=1883 RepID=UPI003409E88E